jgi:hypothetical protein
LGEKDVKGFFFKLSFFSNGYRTILNQSLVECSLPDSLPEFASKLSWLPLLKTEKKIRGNKIKNKKYHRVEFEPSYGRIVLGLVEHSTKLWFKMVL